MVHLTFIHQAYVGSDFKIPPGMAEGVFLLSKLLTAKYGTPQLLYCQEQFCSKVTAKISNLVFHTERINPTRVLNNNASKRELSAFFDFILGEADYYKYEHIVIVCSSQVMDNIFVPHPAVGSSCTLSGEKWTKLLINYTLCWSPSSLETHSDEDLKLITDFLQNRNCSLTEKELINQISGSARFSEYGS